MQYRTNANSAQGFAPMVLHFDFDYHSQSRYITILIPILVPILILILILVHSAFNTHVQQWSKFNDDL